MSPGFDLENRTQRSVTAEPEAYLARKVEDHWMGSMEGHHGFEDGNHHLEELAMKDFWCAWTSHHQILILRSGTLVGWVEEEEQAELQHQ